MTLWHFAVKFPAREEAMDKGSLVATREWVIKELEACVNFWLKNGLDKKHGGGQPLLEFVQSNRLRQ